MQLCQKHVPRTPKWLRRPHPGAARRPCRHLLHRPHNNGNLTTDYHGNTLTYDAWNRLVAVTNADGVTLAAYTYDGLGRRISKSTISGGDLVATHYYFNGMQEINEWRSDTGYSARNVWSPVYVNALLLRDADTDGNGTLDQRLYMTHDANYNVTAAIDTSGTLAQRVIYNPYGVATFKDAAFNATGNDAALVVLYQGMYRDFAVNLDFTETRQYNWTLDTFTSADPTGYPDGLNNMAFVADNPINMRDWSGLAAVGKISHPRVEYIIWPASDHAKPGVRDESDEMLKSAGENVELLEKIQAIVEVGFADPEEVTLEAIKATLGTLNNLPASGATDLAIKLKNYILDKGTNGWVLYTRVTYDQTGRKCYLGRVWARWTHGSTTEDVTNHTEWTLFNPQDKPVGALDDGSFIDKGEAISHFSEAGEAALSQFEEEHAAEMASP